MEIFVAMASYDYEGSDMLGLFSTFAKAEEACHADFHPVSHQNVMVNDQPFITKSYRHDSYYIYSQQLDDVSTRKFVCRIEVSED